MELLYLNSITLPMNRTYKMSYHSGQEEKKEYFYDLQGKIEKVEVNGAVTEEYSYDENEVSDSKATPEIHPEPVKL